MWQKNAGGKLTWIKAKNYCFKLELEGYSDWVLPNRSQLNAVDKKIFNSINRESFHWSSSEQNNGLAEAMDLYSGQWEKSSQTKSNLVRCVRNHE